MMYKKLFLLLACCICLQTFSQDDLMSLLDSTVKKPRTPTYATFKTTRLVNQHTVETLGKNSLDFRIMHRFGDINSKAYNAWGLDGPANIRLTLEYSPTDRLMVGLGRSSHEKLADIFVKYKLLKQTNDNHIPVTLTLFGGAYYTFLKSPVNAEGVEKYRIPEDRLSYTSEIMVARKFSERFSLQLSGAWVHTNMVDTESDPNDQWAAGGLFRLKFTKRQAITMEYFYTINKYQSFKTYDSFGVGYELETGGHVFQVHVTNSFGISEPQFISATRSSWKNAGIRIGFNISRVFSLTHKKNK